MWHKIEAFFLYNNHLQQLQRYRGRSFLLLTALFFVLQCLAAMFWHLSQPVSVGFNAIAALAFVVLIAPLIMLRKTQNIKKTCQTLLVGHFILYSVVIALTGLYHSPLISSLFYLPLIALLSGDAKLSVQCSLYCLLLFISTLVLSQLSLALPKLDESQHQFWYQWSILNAVIISGFLAMAYNRTLAIMSTRLQQQRQAFEQEAYTDNLTLLANFNQLKRSVKALQSQQDKVFLLAVDVAGFQAINNHYGHHTGDQALQALGKRLLGCANQKDVVARVKADQFLLLLSGIKTEHEQQALQKTIKEQLAKAFYTEKHPLFLTCRVQAFCLKPKNALEPLSQYFQQQKNEAVC